MLYAYTIDYRNHTSLIIKQTSLQKGVPADSVEIHGPVRQELAIAVINNYPLKFRRVDNIGPAVMIEAGKDEGRLFNALKKCRSYNPR